MMSNTNSVYVYIDYENISISWKNTFGLSPDLNLLLTLCGRYGSLKTINAYADYNQIAPREKLNLLSSGIRQINVPTLNAKSITDEVMQMEIYQWLYENRTTDRTLIVVTGDGGFLPVITEATKRLGKPVIVIAVPSCANSVLKQTVREFVPYQVERRLLVNSAPVLKLNSSSAVENAAPARFNEAVHQQSLDDVLELA